MTDKEKKSEVEVAHFIAPNGCLVRDIRTERDYLIDKGDGFEFAVTRGTDGIYSPLPSLKWKPGKKTVKSGPGGKSKETVVTDPLAEILLKQAQKARNEAKRIEKRRIAGTANPANAIADLMAEVEKLRSELAEAKKPSPAAPRKLGGK